MVILFKCRVRAPVVECILNRGEIDAAGLKMAENKGKKTDTPTVGSSEPVKRRKRRQDSTFTELEKLAHSGVDSAMVASTRLSSCLTYPLNDDPVQKWSALCLFENRCRYDLSYESLSGVSGISVQRLQDLETDIYMPTEAELKILGGVFEKNFVVPDKYRPYIAERKSVPVISAGRMPIDCDVEIFSRYLADHAQDYPSKEGADPEEYLAVLTTYGAFFDVDHPGRYEFWISADPENRKYWLTGTHWLVSLVDELDMLTGQFKWLLPVARWDYYPDPFDAQTECEEEI